MTKYNMNPSTVLNEVELKEAKAAESNKTRWEPTTVASNISRSLDSLKTSSFTDNPNEDDEEDDDDNLGESINSIHSSTTASSAYDFLGGLNPIQGIPQIPGGTFPSSEGTPSTGSNDGFSQSNSNKMADFEPDADYGQTIRGHVEDNPDYGDTVRPKPELGPPSKKIVGGVKLMPDVGSNSKTRARNSSPAMHRRHLEREKAQKEGIKTYAVATPPSDLRDLSKLPVLSEDTINSCIESRYHKDLIYTCCGDVLISVNPFRDLGVYTQEQMDQYNHIAVSKDPHIYMVSAKAYQDLRTRKRDQVILVSGESGAGKTEATKLLVRHVIAMAGSDSRTLQEKIIQVNPLLENFGNARTILNKNSSRFAKFLRLKFNENWMVQSGKIQDFMLEKSRVVHYGRGETTFHAFYAFLAGIETPTILYIEPGQTFRITGDFSTSSRLATEYKEKYQQQQKVFRILNLKKEEIEDIHVIMAAILHIGDIEFDEAEDDCVNIKNEVKVQHVANLLNLDIEKLTQALIQRTGTTGKDSNGVTEITPNSGHRDDDQGEVIHFSKKKSQAEDERDALAKTLYEKLFGWLVRKINDALAPIVSGRKNCGSIGILDICGFENLGRNSFEQLCINIINEHLQNFMNKKIIDDEKQLYEDEGVGLDTIDTVEINNDLVLLMFMKKGGILDSIDEDSKHEVSANDVKMVRKLGGNFKEGGLYIPSVSDVPEFSIKHFAGKVKYDGRSFIKKNNDILGDLLEECFKASNSLLVKDLFHAPKSTSGTISMSNFTFQGSKREGNTAYRPVGGENLSKSINMNFRKSLKSRFGGKMPSVKSDFSNRKTHIFYFRNSLSELKRSMESANPFFVRCIKPNNSMKPQKYDQTLVQSQLKYNGIAEIARIRSCNLPVRMVKSDFVHRYGDLVPEAKNDHVNHILRSVSAQPNTYKIGNNQVFTTGQVQAFLEEDLTELRRKQEEERRIREERERKAREEEERRKEIKRKEENARLAEYERLRKRDKEKTGPPVESIPATLSPYVEENKKKVGFQMDTIRESETPSSGASEASIYNRIPPSSSGLSPSPSSDTLRTSTDGDGDDSESNDAYVREWTDHFGELTEEEVREDMGNLLTLKVIKVFVYLFLALLLLISLVIQKVSFITLVMELRPTNAKGVKQTIHAKETKRTVAYFMLIIVVCIPYAISFILSLLKLMFGIAKSPSLWTWIWVLSIECLHSFGMCLLVFRVMKNLDHLKAAYILSATAVFPALIKFFMSDRKEDLSNEKQATKLSWKVRKAIGAVFDLLAFAVQATAPFFIKWLDFDGDTNLDIYGILELVGALVLVSANQWENFADGALFGVELQDESWYKNKVLKIRYELQECRHYPNIVAYFIKIGLTVLLAYLLRGDIVLEYKTAFDELYKFNEGTKHISAIIAVTISAFIAFNTSIGALKFQMQRFSFALPLCLATPITVGVLFLDCEKKFLSVVTEHRDLDSTKNCMHRLMWDEWYHVVIFGAVWLLSLLIVCRHIWKQQLDKNSNMARLFVNPTYCGILTSEQIMLNQRRHQCKVNLHYKFDDNEIDIKSLWYKIERLAKNDTDNQPPPVANAQPQANDQIGEQKHVTPKIYACATMWHETRQEMVQLLKSLHRLDYDQYLRKINQREGVYDPNFYEYEAHIFFDDAMELDDDNARVPNRWVKDLVSSMGEACSSVHGKPMNVHPPVKMATPYGGQLMWMMPGENLLFVHLKDMSKIRNRKRWSQVMYMYYLLDYRLKMFSKHEALSKMEQANIDRGRHGLNIDELNVLLGEEHTAMSNQTFILALDGDTDFNPSSIRILMQRMDEQNVGATCGRIHPIGKGPIVWYQKFEYAVGHWLQKAAEHVFGCVLCSPGCFSLFRARALMDTNVIRRYTTEPTEPGHHLQYDQGEDRWLCTLMLQRGYRIEYAAGADAWTFAPEGFNEFYNQRRRWMPSTIANILDLLTTSEKTRKINANISRPYIMYTWLLMAMTLLGPGTILMMIAGAFQLIFKIQLLTAYLWAVIPAALYTVACFWLKSRWQLLIAAVLSIIYAFVMLIVIVGTIITATTENIFHPSVIIMVLLLSIFLLTGLCHPKEYGCLIHGVLYIVVIPSGYLLLVIFSICNLNDVSWGTREVPTKAQRLEMELKKKQKEEEKLNKVKKGFFQKLFDRGESSITELTNLLRTLSPKSEKFVPVAQADRGMIDILRGIENNTKTSQELLHQLVQEREQTKPQTKGESSSSQPPVIIMTPPSPRDPAPTTPSQQGDETELKKTFVEDKLAPRWTKDKGLGDGKIIPANKDEIRFWNGLVETYLKPIYPTKKEKKDIADGLRELRNSAAFAFILLNGFWMAFNFMFQYTQVAKVQVTYQFGDSNYEVEESVLGLSFVFLLLILLVLQFIGMIIHRMGTLQQLLSTTRIFGENEDVKIGQIGEIEEAIQHMKMILGISAFNDQGCVTESPVMAEPGNPLGISVRASSGQVQRTQDMGQSVRAIGTILDATRKRNSFIDRKSVRFMNDVKKKLDGTNRFDGIGGASFRPNLPPRNNSATSSAWLNKQSNWGITAQELRRLRPNQNIIESDPQLDPRQFLGVGALGRSLHQRALAIQEVQEEQEPSERGNVRWNHSDLQHNNTRRNNSSRQSNHVI